MFHKWGLSCAKLKWRNYITQTKMEILLHCNKISILILTLIEMQLQLHLLALMPSNSHIHYYLMAIVPSNLCLIFPFFLVFYPSFYELCTSHTAPIMSLSKHNNLFLFFKCFKNKMNFYFFKDNIKKSIQLQQKLDISCTLPLSDLVWIDQRLH